MSFPTLLYVLLLTSASGSLANASDTTFAGTDISQIREKALTLYDVADIDSSIPLSIVYPELRFACFGSITSIWFIGTDHVPVEQTSSNNGSEAVYPEFRVWRGGRTVRVPQTQFNRLRGSVRNTISPSSSASLHANISSTNMTLYEYRLEDPMQFKPGDVLGFNQTQHSPLVVRSLSGGGVRNYKFVTEFRRYVYSPSLGLEREPLLALEVTGANSACLEGFLSVDALKSYLQTNTVQHSSGEETSPVVDIPENPSSYVFPSLQFSENGLLEKWLFAAGLAYISLTIPQSIPIEFQLWRNVSDGVTVTTTAITTAPVRSGYPNVYEYTVDPPLPVLAGDYIGVMIELPSYLRPQWVPQTGLVYYEASIPVSGEGMADFNNPGSALPLIAAQVRVTAEPSSASTGSLSTPFAESSIQSSSVISIFPTTTIISSISSSLQLSTSSATIDTTSTVVYTATSILQETSTTLETLQSIATLGGTYTVTSSPFTSSPSYSMAGTPPTSSALTTSFALTPTSKALSVASSPGVSNSQSPSSSNEGTSSNLAGVVTAIITILVLLAVATAVLLIVILYLRRKRQKNKPTTENTQTLQEKRSGFFDNPVYDHLQRKLSRKDSHGYSTIYDRVYLEVQGGNAPHASGGDDDSGYAELEVKVTSPSSMKHTYSPLIATPSPCASPYPCASPSPRASPHASPRGSPAPSNKLLKQTPAPVKFHAYHTLEKCQLPEDYIEPRPTRIARGGSTETLLRTATCRQDLSETTSQVDHEYHELEPSSGGYHRLYDMTGIYVPTQAERRESAGKETIYATIGEKLYAETRQYGQLTFFEEKAEYWKPAFTTDGLYSQLAMHKYREILHSQIIVQHVLGAGNFGEVNKGKWQCEQGSVEVAVKTLKAGSSEEDTVRFLQEAAIMGQFRHPNIVELLGVVTLAERTMIVLEYMSHGDLGTFLLNNRPISGAALPQDTPYLLLGVCRDVASGMEYLQRKAFVHRDLAARNILVSEENQCKIGDFGLSRDLLDENYYISKGGMIPIKWTAPEALNYRKYSSASDVWSFGCVMYEIWSLGHIPFEKHTPEELQKVYERGERLAPPPGCPRGVYSLMIDCWHPDHSLRPSFLHLLKTLASSPSMLLSWSHEDTWGVADAITLGAPLDAGKTLYPELQHTYTSKQEQ